MSVGAQVHVGNGGTFDREGLSFGGFNMLPAGDGEQAEVDHLCLGGRHG